MKKMISMSLALIMVCILAMPVSAAEVEEKSTDVKTIEVDMGDVVKGDMEVFALPKSNTKILTKDYATSTGQTGVINSVGQIVDFSSIILAGSEIVSISIYCPTATKVTQSKYTSINNYIISSYETGTEAKVAFKKTNSPSSTSTTTVFAGENANVKFLVRIQGKILQQYTGMDGFTVFGGKMIVTYK